jgi:hypothetical protein
MLERGCDATTCGGEAGDATARGGGAADAQERRFELARGDGAAGVHRSGGSTSCLLPAFLAEHLDINTQDAQVIHKPRVVLLVSDCNAGHLFDRMSLPCSSTSSASRQANDLPLSRMPLSVGDLFLPSFRCTVLTMQTVFCLSDLQ